MSTLTKWQPKQAKAANKKRITFLFYSVTTLLKKDVKSGVAEEFEIELKNLQNNQLIVYFYQLKKKLLQKN